MEKELFVLVFVEHILKPLDVYSVNLILSWMPYYFDRGTSCFNNYLKELHNCKRRICGCNKKVVVDCQND